MTSSRQVWKFTKRWWMASVNSCGKLKEKCKISWAAFSSIQRISNCMFKTVLTNCIEKDRKKFTRHSYSAENQRLKRLQTNVKNWRKTKKLWKLKFLLTRLQHSRLVKLCKFSVAYALWLKKNEQSRIARGAATKYRERSCTFSRNQISGTCLPSTESLERMLHRQRCLSQSKS